MTFRFSRSHQATERFCRRKLWLCYYLGGTGYVPRAVNAAQSVGSLTHDIITSSVKAAPNYGLPAQTLIDNVVEGKAAEYRKLVSERGYDSEWAERDLDMQCAIGCGLARTWLKYRLPKITDNHRIIAIEEEWNIPIAPDIEMMQRHDMVMEREDGELLTLELKTTGMMTDSYLESWRYSQQPMTQLWGLEQHYGRPALAVQMEFLYKGRRERGSYSGPFVKAWRHESGEVVFAYPGARKGWEVVDAWTLNIEPPREILLAQLSHMQVMRNEREIDIWLTQTRHQQREIAQCLDMLEGEPDPDLLAMWFPARMDEECKSNRYYKPCPYLDHCYGLVDDIRTSDLYQPRVPHHEQEGEE